MMTGTGINNVLKKFFLWSIAIAIISLSSFEPWGVSAVIFWDQDAQSVIIEAATSEDLQSLDFNSTQPNRHHRVKRQFGSPFQFQFPAGWPFIQQHQQQPGGGGSFPGFPSGFPGFPQQVAAQYPTYPTQPPTTTTTTTTTTTPPPPPQMGSCLTRNGLQGRCATFRSCYSFVFSSIEGEADTFRNPGLAQDIRDRAGPCDVHTMPNYLIFRADAQIRDNMICCAGSDSGSSPTTPTRPQNPGGGNPFYPQITMRPPWAIWASTTTKTTTTTPRPTTTTTTTPATTTISRRPWITHPPPTQRISTTTFSPQYPSWPPPFITHPPSHFPSWVHQQWGTQRTTPTTTTTTPAPMQHWPPHQQYPTHHPPSHPIMTTPASITQAPVSSSCGFGKIVGGSQATKGTFPWLVAIMRHGRQICGASLIDSQWILSAAHCFVNFQPHDVAGLRIQIGDYDIYSNTDGPVTIRGVSKLVRHTGFNMAILHNDIALLKLDSPVQFGSNGNNNIQPICLTRSGGYEGTTVTVAGWGGIYEGGPQPAIYKKVDLQVWDNSQCAAKYGHRAPGGITSQMVCAGSAGADACRGDSGGPLMRANGPLVF